jgi:hypothetical protein
MFTRALFTVLVSLALVSCVDDATSSTSQALGSYCASDCDCPLDTECDPALNACRAIIKFGPIPVFPAAGATCQCPYGTALRGGLYCIPVSGACASDCDCGNGNTCWSGTCGPSFSPVAECATCAARCGAGEVCDGQCVFSGGGTGGGGGGGGDRSGDL